MRSSTTNPHFYLFCPFTCFPVYISMNCNNRLIEQDTQDLYVLTTKSLNLELQGIKQELIDNGYPMQIIAKALNYTHKTIK